MNLSDDRISHISHLITEKIVAELNEADNVKVLKAVKEAFHSYSDLEVEINQKVCDKINSLKKGVQTGSREWDLLYRQYFNEVLARRGMSK